MCDVKAALPFWCMNNKVAHLVLRDEPVGLYWLLPLQEDHVIEWREGQRFRSDASRNCRRREKQALLKQNTGIEVNTAVLPGGGGKHL